MNIDSVYRENHLCISFQLVGSCEVHELPRNAAYRAATLAGDTGVMT